MYLNPGPQFILQALSFTRNFFTNFKEFIFEKNYEKLEIDTRLNIYSHLEKNRTLYDEILTNYNQNSEGIMSTYKKFNKDWWHRRFQAHEYLNKINLKRNYQINKKLDYYITNLAK